MQKGRRKKVRYIQKMPQIVQFSPRGKPGRPDEVELTIDQFEAVKLADYQGYDQFEGAKVMGVSRPTFGRSLRQGRKILADALVNGKTLRIRMGNVQVGVRKKSLPHRSEMNKANQNEEMVRQAILGYAEHKDGRQQESRVEP